MNFDLSEFMEQFDGLELDNIGQWPKAAKIVLSIFLVILVLGLGYVLMISDQIEQLKRVTVEETTLKQQYQAKYHIAANLELFEQQMIEAEAMFANQLKSLPESHETPGLLDDITFVGTTTGLNFVKLNWQPEIEQEIYIELPIDIEVIGTYHEFGQFVSRIAGLPRIVTLHDFDINLQKQASGDLKLKLQAKTYRYREAAE
ncbi:MULTISPECIES: type 4a pilus biogenesis protein PilO [unclassified Colwellia]|jgi:type IV pilus assembly protein PilO|uniref:type 4a pilus biogenesis protein PilO n=1 Tax=unclassified Colwellia TaxID=196834 RepID=UPI000D3D1247|nr:MULTISPECIES: type 4a pilus biogenesis protein PilO [unclassified Colwellia]AWB56262.1 pilus assembly protein PilP [Colwellia sp. Arc7-D]MBA6417087.1 type 4a pilus biogenesis protein PilO [Colwellia sp. 6M3]|tara:strand:- start:1291 stop:1896 length:606 start_codon:yes stop_codon:yes gene_type:complete